MHSISIQMGELGELGSVVLDPASVDFLLPYQHQSEAKPWYQVGQWELVPVSHDLLSSSSYSSKSSLGRWDGFQIAEWQNPVERSYTCTKARTLKKAPLPAAKSHHGGRSIWPICVSETLAFSQ
jgi:hypothetical protein